MAVSRKVEREILRNEYLEAIILNFLEKDEQVLRVKSNEIAIPVVGCEGNEDFIVVTVKVPTGANKGLEPYDGFELAEDYDFFAAADIICPETASKYAVYQTNVDKIMFSNKILTLLSSGKHH